MHTQLLEAVRTQIRETFQSQGCTDLDDWCETILVREGFYCGRCFTSHDLRAIWFVEEQVIKFYGPGGEFVSSMPTNELSGPDSAVA